MNGSEKVILNNDASETRSLVEKMALRLNFLKNKNPIAFDELYTKCKDDTYKVSGQIWGLLSGLNLLDTDYSVSNSIRNIVLASTKEESGKLILIDPIKSATREEIKDIFNDKDQAHQESSQIAEIQKNLFGGMDSEERGTSWQMAFRDFITYRKIQEADYPIVAELYTYPNEEFISWFHNTINFQRENFGEDLKLSMPHYIKERPELKRFFELFLLFFEKYDWIATNHLNNIMADKEEFKFGLESK